jgi:maleate isomerase
MLMTGNPCRALLVVPAANTTMADEIAALCPWIGELMVARVPSPPEGIAGNLPGYRANTMEAARPFAARKPDLVMFGCTAAGFYGGPAGNSATVEGLRALTGSTVVSTSDAMMEVLAHEGASRVAVVTPYARDVNDRLVAYLEGSGVSVTVLDSFLCATSAALLAITEEQVLAKTLATDLSGAQALFLACSQMPTLGILPRLRAHAGMPVWSSVSATAWAAERAWRAASRRAA